MNQTSATGQARRESTPHPDFGRIGSLEARLACSQRDVEAAQRLRYRVFYEELGAEPDEDARRARRDRDKFDPVCDHVLILDHGTVKGRPGRDRPKPVGTYRLLRQHVAEEHFGFYSETEFGIAHLVRRKAPLRFLELGRSCVLPKYRTKRTLELLWHAIWRYCRLHEVDVLFGCASFPGTDPNRLALPLSFLHHNAAAPPSWSVSALTSSRVEMNRLDASRIDTRAALRSLPPLIRGYLALGAFFGDGAAVDEKFGTIDVLTVLPVSRITQRYTSYFGADAERHLR